MTGTATTIQRFDSKIVRWQTIEGIDHLSFFILHIDETDRSVDLLFKFSANRKILLHRHKAAYRTFVLEGELRLYRPDGVLKDVRPAGSYVVNAADGEPHTEGGGEHDVVALFSNRNVDDIVYEILDDNLDRVGTFTLGDFGALLKKQAEGLSRGPHPHLTPWGSLRRTRNDEILPSLRAERSNPEPQRTPWVASLRSQ